MAVDEDTAWEEESILSNAEQWHRNPPYRTFSTPVFSAHSYRIFNHHHYYPHGPYISLTLLLLRRIPRGCCRDGFVRVVRRGRVNPSVPNVSYAFWSSSSTPVPCTSYILHYHNSTLFLALFLFFSPFLVIFFSFFPFALSSLAATVFFMPIFYASQ